MKLLSETLIIGRGEVWWVAFAPSLVSEIRKTRPAVIVRNDAANGALTRVVVVPMTSYSAHVYHGEALVMVENHQTKIMADLIDYDCRQAVSAKQA